VPQLLKQEMGMALGERTCAKTAELARERQRVSVLSEGDAIV
jgi:hypothetical protein